MTIILNVLAGPEQAPADGVTMIVDRIGAEVVFDTVNEGIFPLPLAANPIEGLLFVQLKFVPDTVLTKFIAEAVLPLHSTWF